MAVTHPTAAQWLARSDDKYLQEAGDRYLQEGAASFFLREEIALTPSASQISGEGLVTGDVGGVVPAGKPARDVRRRYIMPDGRVFIATTEEVVSLLRLYAAPKEALAQLTAPPSAKRPQVEALLKRDIRFVPAEDTLPGTFKAVLSERFAYRAPEDAYRQAEITANRIRADEEALLLLI